MMTLGDVAATSSSKLAYLSALKNESFITDRFLRVKGLIEV